MTAPPGYKYVSDRSLLIITVCLVVAVGAALGLGALFLLVSDTRTKQGEDRVVIQRISKSPCANLSRRECQLLLVTPRAVIEALRKAGVRASSIALPAPRGSRGAARGRGAAARGRTGRRRGHGGGRGGGTRNPSSSSPAVTPAQAPPQPDPSPPALTPQLPSVPPICVNTAIAGVCVGG